MSGVGSKRLEPDPRRGRGGEGHRAAGERAVIVPSGLCRQRNVGKAGQGLVGS